ncbi:hypothetical protein FOL47_009967 [Perkinsus chesapeaki]|uniref:Uncharacterized protein n=1 Tax=Perkinsus chesapeaki TaxID=330153 RepID=A0A7J6L5K0_PERCH|nr:hypothetical protein FOL47_009967 [Perkinsus chesapeaki]
MLSSLTALLTLISLRFTAASLAHDSFTPDVQCGTPFAMFHGDGSRTDILCVIITNDKPNYLVLTKEESNSGPQMYHSEFCALRERSDGSFGSDKNTCAPDDSRRFTFVREFGTSILRVNDAEMTLTKPMDFALTKDEVFTSNDPATGEVGMLFRDGRWYFKMDNQFVEIPTICPLRKPTLKDKLLPGRRNILSHCKPMQAKWTYLSLGGLDYHLYFGTVVERFSVERSFVLVAKRPEEYKLEFSILLPAGRALFKEAFPPFQKYDKGWRTPKKRGEKKRVKRLGRGKLSDENKGSSVGS